MCRSLSVSGSRHAREIAARRAAVFYHTPFNLFWSRSDGDWLLRLEEEKCETERLQGGIHISSTITHQQLRQKSVCAIESLSQGVSGGVR